MSFKIRASAWLADNISEDSVFHGLAQNIHEHNLISYRIRNHAAVEGAEVDR